MAKADNVDRVLTAVQQAFGKDGPTVMRLDSEQVVDVESIPTGSYSLDVALGCGGFPRGRIIEIYGPESSGKTTLTLHAIAEAQKQNLVCGFVDAEHALDIEYAAALGVQTKDLLLSQPDNGEQALEVVEKLVQAGAGLVVIDSVAALVPKAEIEGDMGDSHVGLQARLMSQALRKLTAITAKAGTTIIFINQIRHKIGVMYGSPETTTGGNALKFYASIRLDVRQIGKLTIDGSKEGEKTGARTRVKVVKNKMAPPFREVEFDVMYGQGISRIGDLLDVASTRGIVERAGAWYSYKAERIGQGRSRAVDFLGEHPELVEQIVAELKKPVVKDKA